MTFPRFPFALYKGGIYVVAADAAEEAALRLQGWDDYVVDKARMEGVADAPAPAEAPAEPVVVEVSAEPPKRGPGRPRKA